MDEKERIIELRKKLEELNVAYYDNDEPLVPDYEYDMMMQELKKLEEKHPEMKDNNSPSSKVGGHSGKSTFAKVKHDVQMQSLLDVFSYDDVKEFIKTVKEQCPAAEFSVEPKIDGLSISVLYENGKMVCGSTRGDGYVGEDVSANILEIESIPANINTPGVLEVRGEAYMDRATLERLNTEREANEEKLFANARNAAAGSLRQIDASLVKDRGLKCFIFNIQKDNENTMTHSAGLEKLKKLGFTTIDSKILSDTEDILKEIEAIGASRESRAYDIDGAVIKVNNLEDRNELGVTAKYPKWAVAFKYPPEEKKTIVTDIICQVGRTGRITPVAVLKPIRLAGTTVSRATLHNQDFINSLSIRIGDTIVIRKAAEIIPEIIKVVEHSENSVPYSLPNKCPVCGGLTERGDEADLRCTNPCCSAQFAKTVENFASRRAMNIDGMGEKAVAALIDGGYIKDLADIYCLESKKDELIENKVIGAKKGTENLIKAINESKKNNIDKLITGFGIRNVGTHLSKKLVDKFGDMSTISKLTKQELIQVEDMGDVSADYFIEYFAKSSTQKLLAKLEAAGVNMTAEKATVGTALGGKTFVITGTLPSIRREEAEMLIIANGGKCSGSVSKKTDFLLAGEKAGSKLQKAKELGISIISEEEFKKLIN